MTVPVSKPSVTEQLELLKPSYLPGVSILFHLLFEPPFLLTFPGTFIAVKNLFLL